MARNRTVYSPWYFCAESLFLIGGEDMRPFYPQGGLDPEHDYKFPEPYLRTHAAIDELSILGDLALIAESHEVIVNREKLVERVGRHVADAEKIEAARIKIAHKIAKIYRPYNLDPTD